LSIEGEEAPGFTAEHVYPAAQTPEAVS